MTETKLDRDLHGYKVQFALLSQGAINIREARQELGYGVGDGLGQALDLDIDDGTGDPSGD